MFVNNITPTSKLRVVFNNTANELTYPALASGDFDSGVFDYCDAYTQYEKTYGIIQASKRTIPVTCLWFYMRDITKICERTSSAQGYRAMRHS